MKGYDKALRRLLEAAGCNFLRNGKGDTKSGSPISKQNFVIDGGVTSGHTANAVLKQAGLQKAF